MSKSGTDGKTALSKDLMEEVIKKEQCVIAMALRRVDGVRGAVEERDLEAVRGEVPGLKVGVGESGIV